MKSEYREMLPPRTDRSHKGTYGTLFALAGSADMAGAAVLCARSAYRMGTGLVQVATPECNRVVIQQAVPEAIYAESGDVETLERMRKRATALALGPGIGTRRQAQHIMRWMLSKLQIPTVIDADGLNIIAQNEDVFPAERAANPKSEPMVIFTPHFMEMSRLTGRTVKELMDDPGEAARRYAEKMHIICVLKDHRSVISDGKNIYYNETGCSGMSTAGSGDVLTGMIGGLLAQGVRPLQAARLGVYLHGRAGEIAAEKYTEYSMMASDIEAHIGDAIRELLIG